jgi:hypothetical protein
LKFNQINNEENRVKEKNKPSKSDQMKCSTIMKERLFNTQTAK